MHSFQAVTMGYVFGAWTCLGGEICPWQRWEENVAPGPKQAERGARRGWLLRRFVQDLFP